MSYINYHSLDSFQTTSMKKVRFNSNWSFFQKVSIVVFILFGISFVLRWLDQNYFQYKLPYGYFHYPPNQTIPFFRSGEPEPGKIGKFGIRESSLKENASCHFLLLGDSQTFGSGIFWQDTFSEILNRETICQWTNVSMPGFTIDNEIAIFQKIKGEIPFDQVYLVVYGNDIYEIGDTPDYIHFVDKQKWYVRLLSYILPEYTRLDLKKKYFDSVQLRMEEEIQKYANIEYNKHFPKSKKDEVEVGNENFLTFLTLFSISPNYFKQSLDVKSVSIQNYLRWKRVFDQLYEEVSKNQKKLTIVYIPLDVEFDPARYQIYERIGFPMEKHWLEGDSEFVLELQSITKEYNLKFIDLRSVFRTEKQLLQKEDIHYNEKANRLVADKIKKMLE
ncbi:SGNH/GDSL hydrolase family protein [Leptospira bouyouniensis]|nr:SGNH/GDSL hydrolase family protein [Leptospira bouyouniensis]